jgi:hypothetical protein
VVSVTCLLQPKPGRAYRCVMARDEQIQKMAARLAAADPQTGGGRGRRSPLYRWLFARAEDFRALLDEQHPVWADVAKSLIETDAVDPNGQVPSAERVRKAWYEVRQAKGWITPKKRPTRSRSTQASKPGGPAHTQSSPVISLGSSQPDNVEDDFVFRTIKKPDR